MPIPTGWFLLSFYDATNAAGARLPLGTPCAMATSAMASRPSGSMRTSRSLSNPPRQHALPRRRRSCGDGNAYPLLHQQGLCRPIWSRTGSRSGVLLSARRGWAPSATPRWWSGRRDVKSTFADLSRQVRAGLNMAMSRGIPWWTPTIGGFKGGGYPRSGLHELLIPLVPVWACSAPSSAAWPFGTTVAG